VAVRVCFVVNNVKTQRATYTTLHLGYQAWRRGHDVRFMSVDAFSYGDDNRVIGQAARPPAGRYPSARRFHRALVADDVAVEEVCLSDFDVVFYGDTAVASFVADIDAVYGTEKSTQRLTLVDVYHKEPGGWIQVASSGVDTFRKSPAWGRSDDVSAAAGGARQGRPGSGARGSTAAVRRPYRTAQGHRYADVRDEDRHPKEPAASRLFVHCRR